MLSIIIASLAGIGIMVAASLLFYRRRWKSIAVIALFIAPGVFLYRMSVEYFPALVAAAAIGIIAGYSMREKKSFQFYLICASCAVGCVLSVNFYALKFGRGIDLFNESRTQFIEYVNKAELPEEKKLELRTSFDAASVLIRELIPFSYFMNGLFFAAIAYAVVRFILRMIADRDAGCGRGIEYFRLNDYLIYTLIVGWLGVMLIDAVRFPWLHALCLNTALIFSMLYVIQAMGIVKYFTIKKGFSFKLVAAVFLAIVLFFNEALIFAMVIMASIGAIDFWADFRKLESAGRSGE